MLLCPAAYFLGEGLPHSSGESPLWGRHLASIDCRGASWDMSPHGVYHSN